MGREVGCLDGEAVGLVGDLVDGETVGISEGLSTPYRTGAEIAKKRQTSRAATILFRTVSLRSVFLMVREKKL